MKKELKKKNATKRINYQKFFPMIIFISILFMSVGYAAIIAIQLDVEGTAIAKETSGIYIKEAVYYSDVDADTTNSKIINSYQTMVRSDITLSSTNSASSITYKITVYNASNMIYYYNGLKYELGDDTYSNENINATTTGIELDEAIAIGASKTFYLTFAYNNNTLASSSNLKSYITIDFSEIICPRDGKVCDISGNENHLTMIGATWNKNSQILSTDGIDDYLYLDNLNWDKTNSFTIEFIAHLPEQPENGVGNLLFESSVDSNSNYGSFYIDTNEFGTNELTLAMKYSSSTNSLINHKYVNNIIDNNTYRHYTITFNSLNSLSNVTRIYLDGVYQTTTTHPDNNGGYDSKYDGDITGNTISNYPLYIASRAGTKYFAKMNLKMIRIYNTALTDEEVLENYNSNIKTDNLLAHYDFR